MIDQHRDADLFCNNTEGYMATAWIESHTVLIRHRKLVDLASKLRLKPVYVLGHFHALWHTALEQAEDGDLSSWSDEFVAASSYYEGDCAKFVSLLESTGWLDEGRLLHDWLDYAGRYLEARYRSSNPERLREIWKKHGRDYDADDRRRTTSRTTVGLKSAHLPNLPNQPTYKGRRSAAQKMEETVLNELNRSGGADSGSQGAVPNDDRTPRARGGKGASAA